MHLWLTDVELSWVTMRRQGNVFTDPWHRVQCKFPLLQQPFLGKDDDWRLHWIEWLPYPLVTNSQVSSGSSNPIYHSWGPCEGAPVPRSPGSLMLAHGLARPCRRRCSLRKGRSMWNHRRRVRGVLETTRWKWRLRGIYAIILRKWWEQGHMENGMSDLKMQTLNILEKMSRVWTKNWI